MGRTQNFFEYQAMLAREYADLDPQRLLRLGAMVARAALAGETIHLLEMLAKTSYQLQITEAHNKECDRPIGYGSGFIVSYGGNTFFITADHNIHVEDHEQNIRTGVDNVVSIFNNISDRNTIQTLVTPLGGFYFAEKFDILKLDEPDVLIDVAICMLNKDRHFQKPFLTDDCSIDGEHLAKQGEEKRIISEEAFADPSPDDEHLIFGKIKPEMKGLLLHRKNTLKEGLRFIQKAGDYYLFNTKEIIQDVEDWEALSGSPVFNTDGKCVGVLCSVLRETRSIFVKPMSQVKLLMDIAIIQEQLDVN